MVMMTMTLTIIVTYAITILVWLSSLLFICNFRIVVPVHMQCTSCSFLSMHISYLCIVVSLPVTCTCTYNLHLLQKDIHWWNRERTTVGAQFLKHLCNVERDNQDTSKPAARHINLCSHSKQHMAVWNLSLHLGSSESCKTLEQKLIFKLALLIPTTSRNTFHSTNLFLFFLSLCSHQYHSSTFCI